MSDEEPNEYRVEADLGSLSLSVIGSDPEWVDETFEAKLSRLLEESADISKALRDGSRGCQ